MSSRIALSLALTAVAVLLTPTAADAGDWLHFGFDS